MEIYTKEFEVEGFKFNVSLNAIIETDYGMTMLEMSASCADGEKTFRVLDCVDDINRSEEQIIKELTYMIFEMNHNKKRKETLLSNGWK